MAGIAPPAAPRPAAMAVPGAVAPPQQFQASATAAAAAAPPLAPPFHFQVGMDKLDWPLLAAIDIGRLTREVNVDVLQRVIENIAFARLSLEEAAQFTPSHTCHLFVLFQLVVQYLVYTQDSIVKMNSRMAEQLAEATRQCGAQEKELVQLKEEGSAMRKELKAQRRTMLAYEFMRGERMHVGSHGGGLNFRCPDCGQSYESEYSMHSHQRKRHGGVTGAAAAAPPPAPAVVTQIESLQKGIQEHEASTKTEVSALRKAMDDFVAQMKRDREESLRSERDRLVLNTMMNATRRDDSAHIPIQPDVSAYREWQQAQQTDRDKAQQQRFEGLEKAIGQLTKLMGDGGAAPALRPSLPASFAAVAAAAPAGGIYSTLAARQAIAKSEPEKPATPTNVPVTATTPASAMEKPATPKPAASPTIPPAAVAVAAPAKPPSPVPSEPTVAQKPAPSWMMPETSAAAALMQPPKRKLPSWLTEPAYIPPAPKPVEQVPPASVPPQPAAEAKAAPPSPIDATTPASATGPAAPPPPQPPTQQQQQPAAAPQTTGLVPPPQPAQPTVPPAQPTTTTTTTPTAAPVQPAPVGTAPPPAPPQLPPAPGTAAPTQQPPTAAPSSIIPPPPAPSNPLLGGMPPAQPTQAPAPAPAQKIRNPFDDDDDLSISGKKVPPTPVTDAGAKPALPALPGASQPVTATGVPAPAPVAAPKPSSEFDDVLAAAPGGACSSPTTAASGAAAAAASSADDRPRSTAAAGTADRPASAANDDHNDNTNSCSRAAGAGGNGTSSSASAAAASAWDRGAHAAATDCGAKCSGLAAVRS